MEVPPSSEDSDKHHRLYLVPFRWWKEAEGCFDPDGENNKEKRRGGGVLYDALPASSSYAGPMKILNIFKSDLSFNLIMKEEEQQNQEDAAAALEESGRKNYALVSADMWLQALKWHSDAGKTSAAAEDYMTDVYPLQLKLSILQESSTLAVRISKKDNAVESFRRACKIFSMESELLHIFDFSGQTTQFLLNDKIKNLKDSPRQTEQD